MSIPCLPDNVLLNIFRFTPVEDRQNFALASKKFYQLSNDNAPWNKLLSTECQLSTAELEKAPSGHCKALYSKFCFYERVRQIINDNVSVIGLDSDVLDGLSEKEAEVVLVHAPLYQNLDVYNLRDLAEKFLSAAEIILRNPALRETLEEYDLIYTQKYNCPLLEVKEIFGVAEPASKTLRIINRDKEDSVLVGIARTHIDQAPTEMQRTEMCMKFEKLYGMISLPYELSRLA